MLIYTNQRSKKTKARKTKSFVEAQENHKKFLAKYGVKPTSRKKIVGRSENYSDLTVSSSCTPVSNEIPGSNFKRTVDDYKWKQGRQEKPEVIAATEEKKKRIAPLWNKGGLMYISEGEDPKTIGKKV